MFAKNSLPSSPDAAAQAGGLPQKNSPDQSRSIGIDDTFGTSIRNSDARLFMQFTNGDAGAFTNLHHRYEKPLQRYLTRVCGDLHRAADVSQKTWMHVIQSAGQYDVTKPFRNWLFVIAHNTATSDFRHNRRHLLTLSLDRQIEKVDSNGAARPSSLQDLLASRSHDPVTIVIKHEEAGRVRQALEKLDETKKKYIVSHFYEDQSIAKIDPQVAKSTNRSRYEAALQSMRDVLTDSPGIGQSEIAFRRSMADRIASKADMLPEKVRLALVHYYVHGKTLQETGDIMGHPKSLIHGYVKRGLALLEGP